MIAFGTVASQLGKQPCQGKESLGADHFSYLWKLLRDTLEPVDEANFIWDALVNMMVGCQQQDGIEEPGVDKSPHHGLACGRPQAVDAKRSFQSLPEQFDLPSNFIKPLNGFAVGLFDGDICDHEIPFSLGFFKLGEGAPFFFCEIVQSLFPLVSRQPQGDDPVKNFTITNFQKRLPMVSLMGFQSFPDIDGIAQLIKKFGDGQGNARDKEAFLAMQAIQILGIKVSEITNDQVSRLGYKDVIISRGVIRARGFCQFEIGQLPPGEVVEGMDFNSRFSSTTAGTWKLFFQFVVQTNGRRVSNQDVVDAWYFDVLALWYHRHLRESDVDQCAKHAFGFLHFFADGLRADFLPNGLSDLKGDIGISQGIGFKETNTCSKGQGGQFSLALEGPGGSCGLFDGIRGKKSSGISVASARSYRWPPCLASLGDGFVLRHHWRPSSLKCPVKSAYYKIHPLRSAPYATLGDCYVGKGLAA